MRFVRLLEAFGSAAAVLAASRRELAAAGVPEPALDYLAAPAWAPVEQDLAWLAHPGNHLLRLTDADYPALLRQIDHPPPLLFVHGDPGCLGAYQIAVVGTRNPTPGGRETARELAAHLAEAGIVITSGLAHGIDAEAHCGALKGQGRTVAVMGTGPDRIYPAQHRELAHRIAERGALVTELPPGTPVLAENFPRRNRLISGLSLGVVVVEAALKSGSLISARHAAEQGREVFAIPGSIHNPMVKGCHRLIRQGAKLVETAADILEELAPLAMAAAEGTTAVPTATREVVRPERARPGQAPPAPLELDEDYRRLLTGMGNEPVAVDLLVERCGLTPEAVSSMLLILELQGHVAAAPGGLYTRLKSEDS